MFAAYVRIRLQHGGAGFRLAVALLVVACGLAGCQAQTQQDANSTTQQKSDELYQVALLQSLTLGDCDGVVSIGELKQRGDVGIGTFDAVNGEMVVLDGTVYQCLGDGTVQVASDGTTTPFSNVTFLDGDIRQDLSAAGIDDLKAKLTNIVNKNGANQFYMVRFDATFDAIGVRSELAQQKPYETFDKVLALDEDQSSRITSVEQKTN